MSGPASLSHSKGYLTNQVIAQTQTYNASQTAVIVHKYPLPLNPDKSFAAIMNAASAHGQVLDERMISGQKYLVVLAIAASSSAVSTVARQNLAVPQQIPSTLLPAKNLATLPSQLRPPSAASLNPLPVLQPRSSSTSPKIVPVASDKYPYVESVIDLLTDAQLASKVVNIQNTLAQRYSKVERDEALIYLAAIFEYVRNKTHQALLLEVIMKMCADQGTAQSTNQAANYVLSALKYISTISKMVSNSVLTGWGELVTAWQTLPSEEFPNSAKLQALKVMAAHSGTSAEEVIETLRPRKV